MEYKQDIKIEYPNMRTQNNSHLSFDKWAINLHRKKKPVSLIYDAGKTGSS